MKFVFLLIVFSFGVIGIAGNLEVEGLNFGLVDYQKITIFDSYNLVDFSFKVTLESTKTPIENLKETLNSQLMISANNFSYELEELLPRFKKNNQIVFAYFF